MENTLHTFSYRLSCWLVDFLLKHSNQNSLWEKENLCCNLWERFF